MPVSEPRRAGDALFKRMVKEYAMKGEIVVDVLCYDSLPGENIGRLDVITREMTDDERKAMD